MHPKRIPVPSNLLLDRHLPADYADAFSCKISNNKNITADDVQVTFWTQPSGIITCLMRLRDLLVRPFGLRGGDYESGGTRLEECIREGIPYSVFTVADKSATETVLCLDDKHLTAYVSALILPLDGQSQGVTFTTAVRFKNTLGRVYFTIIRPFHLLIVPHMLSGTLKKLS